MNTQYPRQSYLDLIQAQIDANAKDADELMVQRLYDVPDLAKLVLDFMASSARESKDRAYLATCIALVVEQTVLAAIEKSEGEMAEIEAMQTPDPEDFDDQAELEKEWSAQADAAGVRRV
jgi:hypothetical protein